MLIKNANIVYPDRIEPGTVRVTDNKIVGINPEHPDDNEILDARGLYLAPGFIDIHIHGAAGRDVMDADEESLNIIAKAIAQYGTTSFAPTTMTMDIPSIHKAVTVAASAKEKGTSGTWCGWYGF